MAKKTKPRCKNCGAETTFPANADWERESFGWCPGCYKTWKKNQAERPDTPPRSIYERKPFSSRPPERDENSYDEFH